MDVNFSSFIKTLSSYEPDAQISVNKNESYSLEKNSAILTNAKILETAARCLQSLQNSIVPSDQEKLVTLISGLETFRQELARSYEKCCDVLQGSMNELSEMMPRFSSRSRLSRNQTPFYFYKFFSLSKFIQFKVIFYLGDRDLARFSSVNKLTNKMLSNSSDFWPQWYQLNNIHESKESSASDKKCGKS